MTLDEKLANSPNKKNDYALAIGTAILLGLGIAYGLNDSYKQGHLSAFSKYSISEDFKKAESAPWYAIWQP